MRSFVILMAALVVSLAGCVTMPDPVPVNYLAEKTAEQGKALEKLENGIIAKNHEVMSVKDKIQAAEQKVKVEKGRLDILKDEKKLLTEKQKQYQLENDTAKISENTKQMVDKEGEIETQGARLDHASASSVFTRAQKEVGEAELSVMVAELNFEKARIAKDYLIKRQGAVDTGDKKDASSGPEKYDEKYKAYLDKQRENLVAKKALRDEASLKLKIAEDKLKK